MEEGEKVGPDSCDLLKLKENYISGPLQSDPVAFVLKRRLKTKSFNPVTVLAVLRKAVADITHGLDKDLPGDFYFASEPPDMHIHRPVAAKIIISPDLI